MQWSFTQRQSRGIQRQAFCKKKLPLTLSDFFRTPKFTQIARHATPNLMLLISPSRLVNYFINYITWYGSKPSGLRHCHCHGPNLCESLPEKGQCAEGDGPGISIFFSQLLTVQLTVQAKNAMEVYSKAMELDPNSDEAKNGENNFKFKHCDQWV